MFEKVVEVPQQFIFIFEWLGACGKSPEAQTRSISKLILSKRFPPFIAS